MPLVGGMATHALEQIKDGLKAFLTGGMLFEELGFRYFGPIDGHDLPTLRRWLRDVRDQEGPVLLHVLTQKGHGVPQDFVLAYKWLNLAAARAPTRERDHFLRLRDGVASKMSPAPIAEGQRLAMAWPAGLP